MSSNFSNISNISPPIGNMAISRDLSVGNNENINGDLNITQYVNGSSISNITTSNTTFNLINTNATTVNFAGDATSLTIGFPTGNASTVSTINFNGSVNVLTKYPKIEKSSVNSNDVYIIPPDDPNGLVLSTATAASGTVLTLIAAGTAADVGGSNSAVKLGPSRLLTVTHNATENADFIDFVGTDQNGDAQTEILTLGEGGTGITRTTNYWSSITSATFRTADGSGAATNTIQIGWVSNTGTKDGLNYTLGYKDSGCTILDNVSGNVIHSILLQSSTAVNFKQWNCSIIQAIANTGSNNEWIMTAPDDKIFGASQCAVAVGTSDYGPPVLKPTAFIYASTGASDQLQMDTDASANKCGLGAWVNLRTAYNIKGTDNTMFFVQQFSLSNAANNSGASVFG